MLAINEAETLMLGLSDLNRMKQEFLEAYEKIFNNTLPELKTAFIMRLKAMEMCE